MPATATKPLRVELPVCPVANCHRIGKIPGTFASGRFYCTGPALTPHKRTKMEMRRFKEVRA